MKSHAVLLHPTWDVSYPFVQYNHAGYASCLLVTHYPSQLSSLIAKVSQACVQETLILLNNGPKVQE
jgi:hypothetical protein